MGAGGGGVAQLRESLGRLQEGRLTSVSPGWNVGLSGPKGTAPRRRGGGTGGERSFDAFWVHRGPHEERSVGWGRGLLFSVGSAWGGAVSPLCIPEKLRGGTPGQGYLVGSSTWVKMTGAILFLTPNPLLPSSQ